MTHSQAPDDSNAPYLLLVAMVSHTPRFANAARLAAQRGAFYESLRSQLETKLQRQVALIIEDIEGKQAPSDRTETLVDGAVIDLSSCSLAECLELGQQVARVIGPTVFIEGRHAVRSWMAPVITYDAQAHDGGAVAEKVAHLLAESSDGGMAQRVTLARQAAKQDDVLVAGYLQRAFNLTRKGDYAQAVATLTALKPIAGDNATLYQELGIAYGKQDALAQAEASLRRALEIEPEHAEVWANLGGVLRRKALRVGDQLDRSTLQAARDCYARSSQLDPFNTYPLTNLTRIDLLLALGDASTQEQSIVDFDRLNALCREKFTTTPRDYWLRFDLAEAILFGSAASDSLSSALAEFDQAIADVPAEQRTFVFKTVDTVVTELIHYGAGNQPQRETLRTWHARLQGN